MTRLGIRGLCSGFVKELLITCFIYSALTCVGFCRGYSSLLIIQLKADDAPMHLTVDEESWVVALGILPNPLGSVLVGVLIDAVGRKLCVEITFPAFLVGWLIIAMATNVYMLYIGVFINGFMSGMTICNVIYVSEISSARYRGFMLSFLAVFYCWGILLSNISLYYLGWKVSAYILCCTCAILFPATLFLPESPLWLISRGRRNEAAKVLIGLRGGNELDIKMELDALYDFHRSLQEKAVRGLKDAAGYIFRCRKQLAVVIGLGFFQQATGFIVFVSYNASIFQQLDDLPIDVSTASLTYICVLFVTTLCSPVVHHYFRRKPTLIVGSLCCLIGFSLAAAYPIVNERLSEEFHFRCWLPLAFIYSTAIFSSISISTIAFIVPGEIIPSENRGLLMGFYGCTIYFVCTLFVKLFLWYMYTYGIAVVFWTLALSFLMTILFAMCFLPETKGKTLADIQCEYFQKKNTHNINKHGPPANMNEFAGL